MDDLSNGYDASAAEYMAVRSDSGLNIVRQWAASLPQGASVIDIGAGHGEPLTRALIDQGLDVWAIDASPSLVAAFKHRFPTAKIACEAAQSSNFFDRSFDAVLMVGVIFLLDAPTQRKLITRIAASLNAGGRFLFSAPKQAGTWTDVLTGQPSRSLGADAYQAIMADNGLELIATHIDEGGSHYYEARKCQPSP